MGKTYNRTPLTFNLPDDSQSAVFSHTDWKGLSENKNVFSVSQETFEDCKNIYVDEYNVLSSRPALDLVNSSALNDDVFVYKTSTYVIRYNKGEKQLVITSVLDNKMINSLELDISDVITDGEDLYFYEIGDTLFAFGTNNIYKYVNSKFELALNNLYVPDVGDVSNLLTPNSKKLDAVFTVADYNNLLLQSDKYEHNNLTIEVNEKLMAWPRSLERLKYTMVDKVTNTRLRDDILVVINDKPYEHRMSYKMLTGNRVEMTIEFIAMLENESDIRRQLTLDLNAPDSSVQTWINVVANYKSFGKIFYVISYSDDSHGKNLSSGIELIEFDLTTLVANYYQYDVVPDAIVDEGTGLARLYLVGILKDADFNLYFSCACGTFVFTDDSIYFNKRFFIYKIDLNSKSLINLKRVNVADYENFDIPVNGTIGEYDVDNDVVYAFAIYAADLGISKITIINDYSMDIVVYDDTRISSDYIAYYDYIDEKLNIESLVDVKTSKDFVVTNLSKNEIYNNNTIIRPWYYHRLYSYNSSFTSNLHLSILGGISSGIFGTTLDTFLTDSGTMWIACDDGVYVTKVYNYEPTVEYHFTFADEVKYATEFFPKLIGGANDLFLISSREKNKSYVLQTVLDASGNTLLYLPENKQNNFYETINNIVPLNNESTMFFSDSVIWLVLNTGELDNRNLPIYTYTKSKLNLNMLSNSDIIVGYDGATILVPTRNGLAAITYNQLIATQEQLITYLSDNINNRWRVFADKDIRFSNYRYYLFIYKLNSKSMYVYDYRSETWWYWEFEFTINSISVFNDLVLLVTNENVSKFSEKRCTDWSLVSQKLHLNAPTYYKQISKFYIHSVGKQLDSTTMNFKLTNYRKRMFEETDETLNFDIDFVRTYVKIVNYPNVLYTQYTLCNSKIEPCPLYLTGINIEYKIGGKIK